GDSAARRRVSARCRARSRTARAAQAKRIEEPRHWSTPGHRIRAARTTGAARSAALASSRFRRHAVHASPIAREDVFGPLHGRLGTQHALEKVELGRTKALTGAGRGADRTVVLDEEEDAWTLDPHLRHVAFFGPDVRELLEPFFQRG